MALISKWDTVSKSGRTLEYKNRIVTFFVYKLEGLPDLSKFQFNYLAEKCQDRVAELAKKQAFMLRQIHNIGDNWGISLRLIKKDAEINLYIVFRYSGDRRLSNEEIDFRKQIFQSFFPKEYTFSYIEYESVKDSLLFNPQFAGECAEIFKKEKEYEGDTPYKDFEEKVYRREVPHVVIKKYRKYYPADKFYFVPTWKASDNNSSILYDSLMNMEGPAIIDICLIPTKYLQEEQSWININLQRMEEVKNGQKLFDWTGRPVPVMEAPQKSYEKMNRQYEASSMFLCSIRIFSEKSSMSIANTLEVASVENEAQVCISHFKQDEFERLINDYRYLNISSTETEYWIRKAREDRDGVPYRAQRLNRLVSLGEAGFFFRIPIPNKADFPGFKTNVTKERSVNTDNNISKNTSTSGTSAPVVFISYSQEDEEHKEWTRHFVDQLEDNGVKVIFDQYDLHGGADLSYFMEKMQFADKVLLICTPSYKQKADSRQRGVGYEARLMTGELTDSGNEEKFISIIRKGDKKSSVPYFMKWSLCLHFSNDEEYEENFQKLMDQLFNKDRRPRRS